MKKNFRATCKSPFEGTFQGFQRQFAPSAPRRSSLRREALGAKCPERAKSGQSDFCKWLFSIIDDSGTALMEFVMVMPILVFMIFCTIQLSLVCMAKQLTHYAAYSAARAVVVYHPDDFSSNGVFYPQKGVAHRAACTVLSWLGQMPGGPSIFRIPDWGDVPGSGYINQQVAIDPANSAILTDIPAVKVTVKFRYPLLIPFAGNIIGYFHGGGKADGNWDIVGLLPTDMPEKLAATKLADTPCFTLTETCVLPMPWDNNMFPRAEASQFLGTQDL